MSKLANSQQVVQSKDPNELLLAIDKGLRNSETKGIWESVLIQSTYVLNHQVGTCGDLYRT